MKVLLVSVFAGLFCWAGHDVLAQSNSTDVTSVLSSSLAAQSGSLTIQSVVLTGTAERIAGSDDQTVPARFEATSSGSTRSDLSLSNSTLTEIRQTASSGTSGVWSNGDGTNHALAGQNLLTDGAWWFPDFVTQRFLADPNSVVTFQGIENGLAHFTATQVPPTGLPQSAVDQISHLSQVDLFLDSTTLLPARLSFCLHPDDNALVDIPITVQYSNYQTTNGATMPMHVQEFVNDTLSLDITVQAAALNVSIPSTDFTWQ
jgi:hypothetical protein